MILEYIKVKKLTKKTIYYYYLLYNILYNKFLGLLLKYNSIFIYLYWKDLPYCLLFLKGSNLFGFQTLLDITVTDDSYSRTLSNRFELIYIFVNITNSYRFGFKVYTSGTLPIYSISKFFPSSDWLEREVWDMFGIKFLFHQGLRRILTDYGFKGYPLRKNFPLLGYVELNYEESYQSIRVKPLEVSQSLRFFSFNMPWFK